MHQIFSHLRAASWTALAATALLAVAQPVRAEAPAREFLEALRKEGLYDLAADYLERMEKNPAVSQEFRETILYEQGLTLMAVSRSERDFDRRQQQLDEAQKKFDEFILAHKTHDFAPKAKTELANVLVERARVKVAESERAKDDADKPPLMQEARSFYEQALQKFIASQEEIKRKLESLPKLDPEREQDKKRIEYRKGLREDYINVQMVQAVILHEMADTAVDKQERDKMLTAAAAKYGEIYEKYRRLLAGMYALLQQGKCYQEMGGKKNINEALTYYQELMEQPVEPTPFRTLRTKTLVLTLQCWLDDAIEDKKLDKAIDEAARWAGQIRPNEFNDSDWLDLYQELARAYKLKIASLDPNAPPRDRNALTKEASRLVDFGIKHGNADRKKEFLALKTELGGKIEATVKKVDPKNFAEAYTAGTNAWKSIREMSIAKDLLERRLASVKDKDARAEIQDQITDAEKTMIDARKSALEMFEKALQFVEPDTSLDDLNMARFCLSSLHFTLGNLLEAAIYGEFVARHAPGHLTAKNCAIIARAAYQKMYNEAPQDDRDFEAQKIIEIGQLTVEKWPGEPETEEALLNLIKFMVIRKDLKGAKEYLAKVPLDAKIRGEAELSTGQAMWSTYLSEIKPARKLAGENYQLQRDIKHWEDGGTPPEGASVELWKQKIAANEEQITALEEQLRPLKQEAQTTLKDGIERMRKKEVDETLAVAVATLCGIYVDADQPAAAIKLLEDPDIGALTLVEKKHPAVQRKEVQGEVYRTAVKAYFATVPDAADSKALFAKIESAMDGLNQAVGSQEGGQARLEQIYFSLADDVKNLIVRAPPAKRPVYTRMFAAFLDQVTATSDKVNSTRWAAENFYKIGEANDPGGGEPPDEVKEFYSKAAALYQKLIERAETDSSIAPKTVVQFRVRLASALKRQGKFVLAMDQLEEILKEPKQNRMLDVQIAAANCYMDWAESKIGIDRLYMRAINGGRPNAQGANNIWGWGKMASILSRQIALNPELADKFGDTLHAAKINRAECYYRYAMALEGEQRKKNLKYAKQDIRITARQYPTLGGPQTKKRYDELLRKVQSALKESVQGLDAFASVDSGSGDGGGGQ